MDGSPHGPGCEGGKGQDTSSGKVRQVRQAGEDVMQMHVTPSAERSLSIDFSLVSVNVILL